MRLVPLATALVLAPVLALAACADTEPASTAPADTGPTGTGSPGGGAPRVAEPLDAAEVLDAPCAALTGEQLDGFGVGPTGEPARDAEGAELVGPGCAWSTAGTRDSLSVTWHTEGEPGLAAVYGHRDEAAYFEETTVEDHPAVFTDWGDARDAGVCRIVVGVSDVLAFGLTVTGDPDAAGSCDRAEQAAAAVLRNLRGR